MYFSYKGGCNTYISMLEYYRTEGERVLKSISRKPEAA